MVNFLIVDDHDIIREGIKTLLETKVSYTVIDTVSSGEEAYRFLQADSSSRLILY